MKGINELWQQMALAQIQQALLRPQNMSDKPISFISATSPLHLKILALSCQLPNHDEV